MLHCVIKKVYKVVRRSSILKLLCVNDANIRLCLGGDTFRLGSFQFTVSYSYSSVGRKYTGLDVTRGTMFRLSDYDCVGFDLDNTLLRYKIRELVALEYEVMARFLVAEKGYDPEYLIRPLGADIDLLQKGLVLDFERGNVLQLAEGGSIRRASHGTCPMTDEELRACYGEDRQWDVTSLFHRDPLSTWNGPLAQRMRSLLDYFDEPASLVFGRIVDSLDARAGRVLGHYNVWPDVLDGLGHMFAREQFAADGGEYFPALKKCPTKYIRKCSMQVVNWLREIKQSKLVFMVTGSNVDFATFTARNCLGEDWKDLFDVVVCYARKPGFFTGSRPFLRLEGIQETDELTADQLALGNVYSQGNWQDMYSLFAAKTGKAQPKCVYFGDNLIQDLYTPVKYGLCDIVAVVEELLADHPDDSRHPDAVVLASHRWGPYIQGPNPTIWSEIVRKYAKLCVSDVGVLARNPLDFSYSIIDPLVSSSLSGYIR